MNTVPFLTGKGMTMHRPQLVEPEERSLLERAAGILRAERIPESACRWLAELFLDPTTLGEPEQTESQGIQQLTDGLPWRPWLALTNLAKYYEESSGNLALTLLHLIEPLAGFGNPFTESVKYGDWSACRAWTAPKDGLDRIVNACRQHRIDFQSVVFDALKEKQIRPDTAVLLFNTGLIEPSRYIDLDRVIELGGEADWMPRSYSRDPHVNEFDPADLRFWLIELESDAIEWMIEPILTSSIVELPTLTNGLVYSIHHWLLRECRHPESYSEAGQGFADATERCFRALDDRRKSNDLARDPLLTQVWLRLAWMASHDSPDRLDAETRSRVLRTAIAEIGLLRQLMRRAHEPSAADEFRTIEPHLRCCEVVSIRLGGLWRGLKPLLLVFRSLSAPSVASDLRYWSDHPRPAPPQPWNSIPMAIVSLFHNFVGHEQEADPDLEDLRSDFARFCLERLKTRKQQSAKQDKEVKEPRGTIEPDPCWRECYIRAARALRINPGGKGHHILHWSSENDPHPQVREAAKKAYVELRHQPRLPNGFSPRRTVLDAFWWLCQGHLLSLGVEIDTDGAQRTREMEVRRTAEPFSGPME